MSRSSRAASPAPQAPVAQLDRVLPSEGRGHRFESCRVRQSFQRLRLLIRLAFTLHGGEAGGKQSSCVKDASQRPAPTGTRGRDRPLGAPTYRQSAPQTAAADELLLQRDGTLPSAWRRRRQFTKHASSIRRGSSDRSHLAGELFRGWPPGSAMLLRRRERRMRTEFSATGAGPSGCTPARRHRRPQARRPCTRRLFRPRQGPGRRARLLQGLRSDDRAYVWRSPAAAGRPSMGNWPPTRLCKNRPLSDFGEQTPHGTVGIQFSGWDCHRYERGQIRHGETTSPMTQPITPKSIAVRNAHRKTTTTLAPCLRGPNSRVRAIASVNRHTG